ncbi:ribbon-helix-helix protein, CopG family [Halorientalis salina]|uniref:ribbon-helix-helix protein, CopG family n=1 Tax=Halorientalis salina TaxID=2932266 RepID=UPI0010AD82FD|nr:ribbon-helix-helix protein, CopG family [Halorientalis salina]
MVADRITVSLDEDARDALDELVSETGEGNSVLVRRALSFYAANYHAATAESSVDLEEYHELLAGGEHALLDIDFLHILLENVTDADGEWPESFVADVDTVADFHAAEYAERFEDLGELLDWLSVCGFLTVRESGEQTFHVVFPTEDIKWFILRFLRKSTRDLPFELEIEEGVSKVLLTEIEP